MKLLCLPLRGAMRIVCNWRWGRRCCVNLEPVTEIDKVPNHGKHPMIFDDFCIFGQYVRMTTYSSIQYIHSYIGEKVVYPRLSTFIRFFPWCFQISSFQFWDQSTRLSLWDSTLRALCWDSHCWSSNGRWGPQGRWWKCFQVAFGWSKDIRSLEDYHYMQFFWCHDKRFFWQAPNGCRISCRITWRLSGSDWSIFSFLLNLLESKSAWINDSENFQHPIVQDATESPHVVVAVRLRPLNKAEL